MKKENELRIRVNLLLPLDVSILIEKESETRRISRAQFIKEAIHEKLNKIDKKDFMIEMKTLKEEINEIKQITMSIVKNLKITDS